ncbi:MAG: glucosamine-6-phosphate deaminase [Devosia sp.]
MRIEILPTPEDAALHVHDVLIHQLTSAPNSVLGLPTGGTPRRVYAALVASFRAGKGDWRAATTFNLDEYRGLGRGHPQSYATYMRQELFDHVNCPAGSTHIPDGMAPDPAQEASHYEALIRSTGGIDLLLLGLGQNGHIGFNEPGSPHNSLTRLVELAPNTIARNARYFPVGMSPPTQAITMGIGTILAARRLILLVTGEAKAKALRASLHGPVGEAVPGSALQHHANVLVVADEAAASALPERHALSKSAITARRQ